MNEKILGYILLFVGVAGIVISTYNIYQVITGSAKPIQFFTAANPAFDVTSLMATLSPAQVSAKSPISNTGINDGLNLTLHIVLMGIISSAGFKLASLGVMLLRSIEVKLIKSPFETIYPKPPATKP